MVGNDSGSTGDASSTAGESAAPCDSASMAAAAAASGAALQAGYGDGTPLVCFPSKIFLFYFIFIFSIEFRLLLRLRMSAADAVTSARIEMASVPLINRKIARRLGGGLYSVYILLSSVKSFFTLFCWHAQR